MPSLNELKNLPVSKWRLIISPALSGAMNMAIDEAILEFCATGEQLPTLRLYAWDPVCLSLGFAQKGSEADQAALGARGWNLVRRPTGGRAILHTDELTYSVAGSIHEPRLAGGVLESYQRLSIALLAALQQLKIPAEAQPLVHTPADTAAKGPVCFETPSNYEIVVSGKKLIGSAQARRAEGVLQHGSLPLQGDLTRIVKVLHFEDDTSREEAAARLLARAITVEDILKKPLEWSEAANALVAAFRTVLQIDFEEAELSPAEFERANDLARPKYRHPNWTYRI